MKKLETCFFSEKRAGGGGGGGERRRTKMFRQEVLYMLMNNLEGKTYCKKQEGRGGGAYKDFLSRGFIYAHKKVQFR